MAKEQLQMTKSKDTKNMVRFDAEDGASIYISKQSPVAKASTITVTIEG